MYTYIIFITYLVQWTLVSGYQWLIETYARWANDAMTKRGRESPPSSDRYQSERRGSSNIYSSRCVNIQLIFHILSTKVYSRWDELPKKWKTFENVRVSHGGGGEEGEERFFETLRVGAPIRRERAYRSNLGKWEIHPVAEMSHAYRDTAVLFLWCFRVATMIHGAPGFSGSPTSVTPNRSLDAPYGITRPAI